MAAAATVAPVGAAEFFVLLMPEGNATRATVSRGDINVGFVNKLHGRTPRLEMKNPARRAQGFSGEPMQFTLQ
jgi:hypothetical protein